jgi:hypothetical protein
MLCARDGKASGTREEGDLPCLAEVGGRNAVMDSTRQRGKRRRIGTCRAWTTKKPSNTVFDFMSARLSLRCSTQQWHSNGVGNQHKLISHTASCRIEVSVLQLVM